MLLQIWIGKFAKFKGCLHVHIHEPVEFFPRHLPQGSVLIDDTGVVDQQIGGPVTGQQPGRPGLDLFTVEDGVTRDTFRNVSLDPSSTRYIETLVNDRKTGSALVRATDQRAATGALLAVQLAPLAGGDDGTAGLADVDFVGSPTGKTGLYALDTVQDVATLLVPGRATPAVHNAMACRFD